MPSQDRPGGGGAKERLTSRLPDTTFFSPAISTSVTVLTSPGSNRTEAPDGTLSLNPSDCARSKTSARLVSMKW